MIRRLTVQYTDKTMNSTQLIIVPDNAHSCHVCNCRITQEPSKKPPAKICKFLPKVHPISFDSFLLHHDLYAWLVIVNSLRAIGSRAHADPFAITIQAGTSYPPSYRSYWHNRCIEMIKFHTNALQEIFN